MLAMMNYRYYKEFNFATQVAQPEKYVKIKKSDDMISHNEKITAGRKMRIRISCHCYDIQKADDNFVYMIKV